ncbi:GyrI-like domain-containing protein [Winogradskyella sp. PG-2]|uniref:GyrI-like domain-containing protein n=1 Tax=Winogradskyella sp. PG-2 TaxID=754409 RepID=UPI000458688C|nr:GyrI-like domain-containing protein [Winogradskyella sp. PG-2]BAO77394.1 transcriptional regulator, AraC family [Winogradskyella sp. PG-2]
MNPKLIHQTEKKLNGIKSSMHHGQFGNIVALWQRFMPNPKTITNTINGEFIALQEYTNFNNFEASIDIWACVEVSSLDPIPEGMTAFIIPKGEYAVFLHKGMDASKTYQQIMTKWLPTSGYVIDDRPHFQVMGEKYKNGSPDSEEDFYVPIKKVN